MMTQPTLKQFSNFIGGEFQQPSTAKWQTHLNPWTGQPTGEWADSGLLDVVRAIQAGNQAWTTWQKVEASQRAVILEAISDELAKRASELAEIQSRDEGSPVASALSTSIPRAVSIFKAYARNIASETQVSAVSDKSISFTNRLPHGLVAILTPFADPFVQLALKVAPALAAGNVIVCKPSEHSPECAQAFCEVLVAAGVPKGVFNLVQGRGGEIGPVIASHPGLQVISFTGQTETARTVQRDAAEMLKRTHFSLSGRNPVIVFGGVDLKKMMPSIVAHTMHFQGSTCLRGSRLFVQESIYKEFLELYQAEVEKLDPATLGPLNNEGLRAKFISACALASTEKGRSLVGGAEKPENLPAEFSEGVFVRPTAFADLTLCSTLQQEEIIGPFVTISSFKYQHDAIKQANTGPLGLAAWVYEAQGAKAMRVAQKLEFGRVFLNSPGPSKIQLEERLPYSSLKTSGLGREDMTGHLEFFSKPILITQFIGTES